jgi:hypothetical protein
MYLYLLRLQRALGDVLHPVGGLSHRQYRAFKHERRHPQAPGQEPAASGFIDGDYVEQLLDLDRPAQDKVIAALNGGGGGGAGAGAVLHADGSGAASGAATLEEALKVVEELSRLH